MSLTPDALAAGMHAALSSRGWLHVPRALEPAAVAAMVAQLRDEALAGGAPDICDTRTFPRGTRARRVVECAPIGVGAHWRALATSPALCTALDAVLGHGNWELPLNAAAPDGTLSGPRHWYAPIVFPEAPDAQGWQNASSQSDGESGPASTMSDGSSGSSGSSGGSGGSGGSGSSTASSSASGAGGSHHACGRQCGPRACPFMPASALPPPSPTLPPCRCWSPVSRRRWAGLGWHLDSGPGFANDAPRTLRGDPRQGVVLLLLLSDSAPGGGGTALLGGSHVWVYDEMRRAAAAGEPAASHEALNAVAVARLRQLTEAGRIMLPGCSRRAGEPLPSAAPWGGDNGAPLFVEQVTGRAGDCIVMHPLLLHSGTTNMRGAAPRIMVNGMVKIREAAFAARGGALLLEELEARARAQESAHQDSAAGVGKA